MLRGIVLGAVVTIAATLIIVLGHGAPRANEKMDAATASLAELLVQGQLGVIWMGKPLPDGWELCDEMKGKFLYGVTQPVEVGRVGGRAQHTHAALSESQFTPGGPTHAMIGGRTDNANAEGALPPYVRVAFICLKS